MSTRREYLSNEGIPVDKIVGVRLWELVNPSRSVAYILTGDALQEALNVTHTDYVEIQAVYTVDDVFVLCEDRSGNYVGAKRNPPGVPRRED